MAATGSVTVRRPKAVWRDRMRAYRIEVDGVTQGRLRSGESLTLELEPGQHRLPARIDWTGSPEESLAVVAGSSIECVVEPAGSAGSALFQIFGRTSYLTLTVLPG